MYWGRIVTLQIIQRNSSAKLRKNLIAQTVATALAVVPFVSFSAEEDAVAKEDIDDIIVVQIFWIRTRQQPSYSHEY